MKYLNNNFETNTECQTIHGFNYLRKFEDKATDGRGEIVISSDHS